MIATGFNGPADMAAFALNDGDSFSSKSMQILSVLKLRATVSASQGMEQSAEPGGTVDLGMTAWRSIARLLLDRMAYVGTEAMEGHARRVAAHERAASARRSDHWLFRRNHW